MATVWWVDLKGKGKTEKASFWRLLIPGCGHRGVEKEKVNYLGGKMGKLEWLAWCAVRGV